MTIFKSLSKINTLSRCELEHCIQRLTTDLQNYERTCQHYSPEKAKKYSEPYVNRILDMRQQFIDRLNQL